MKTILTAALVASTLFAASSAARAETDSYSETRRAQLEALFVATGDPAVAQALARQR